MYAKDKPLTQATTRPLKHGKFISSSLISSLTTLQQEIENYHERKKVSVTIENAIKKVRLECKKSAPRNDGKSSPLVAWNYGKLVKEYVQSTCKESLIMLIGESSYTVCFLINKRGSFAQCNGNAVQWLHSVFPNKCISRSIIQIVNLLKIERSSAWEITVQRQKTAQTVPKKWIYTNRLLSTQTHPKSSSMLLKKNL